MTSKDKKQWQRDTMEPSVQRFPERRNKFQTDSGLDIDSIYSPEDLPDEPNNYKKKSGAQDAHEAIRQPSVNLHPDQARE